MLNPRLSVAHVVLDHSECAPILQRHRIDFCCRGEMSLEAACLERGLETAAVLRELDAAIAARRGEASQDPRSLSTPALIAFIVSTHHEYLHVAMPFVEGLAAKVAGVHGDHNPKLRELRDVVRELVAALGPHLDMEERTLFPALMAKTQERAVVSCELRAMHVEHLAVGKLLERIRTAADDFALPAWACNSYRALFSELENLEADVLRHVHLENHVLMPRFAEN